MEIYRENSPEILLSTPEERLVWLIEFGYEPSDISQLTDCKRKAITGWVEGNDIDEESADRISSLFIYTRRMAEHGRYYTADIIGMTKTPSLTLMRRSLLEAITIMPEFRHQIAKAFAEIVIDPSLDSVSYHFGEALTPPPAPEISLMELRGDTFFNRLRRQVQGEDSDGEPNENK
jgi:hypothetical protein